MKPTLESLERLKTTGEAAIASAIYDYNLWKPILKKVNRDLEKLKMGKIKQNKLIKCPKCKKKTRKDYNGNFECTCGYKEEQKKLVEEEKSKTDIAVG